MVTATATIAEREAAAVLQTYGRYPVTFVRGDGCRLYDEDGKDYLDCLAGIAVVAVGHANAAVAAAVARQMTRLVHTSNLYYTVPQVELAERLKALSGMDRVFFANCGATANEAAIKLARRWGQKRRGPDCYEIISLLDSFHGRTLAALAATGQPHKQEVFAPLPPGFVQVPAGDIDAMAEAIGPQTAAVMIETTQGEGGVVPLDAGYLQALRALCDEREVLLILDDVQAGLGRTGSWFSWQQLGVEPDIATPRQGPRQRAPHRRLPLDRAGGRLRLRRPRHHIRGRAGESRPPPWPFSTRSSSGICWPTAGSGGRSSSPACGPWTPWSTYGAGGCWSGRCSIHPGRPRSPRRR